MVTCTMYLGVLAGALLHTAVLSTHTVWDGGAVVLVCMIWAAVSWSKDNQQDVLHGSMSSTAMCALSLSIILVVVSEGALFISAI